MKQLTQMEQGQLNAFDLAKYKADWKAYKASLSKPESLPEIKAEESAPPAVVVVPKEKAPTPSPDAVIVVSIHLPNKSIGFSLRKRNVMANINPSKANETEFRNAITNGLAPLLGRME